MQLTSKQSRHLSRCERLYEKREKLHQPYEKSKFLPGKHGAGVARAGSWLVVRWWWRCMQGEWWRAIQISFCVRAFGRCSPSVGRYTPTPPYSEQITNDFLLPSHIYLSLL